MATNQTPNLHLPSFVGADKPSWLGDWNSAMNAIDTGYGEVKGEAGEAKTAAATAQAEAEAASQQATALGSEVTRIAGEQDTMKSEIDTIQLDLEGVIPPSQIKVGKRVIFQMCKGVKSNAYATISPDPNAGVTVLTVYGNDPFYGGVIRPQGSGPEQYSTMLTNQPNTVTAGMKLFCYGGCKGNVFNLTAMPRTGDARATLLTGSSSKFGWCVWYDSASDTTFLGAFFLASSVDDAKFMNDNYDMAVTIDKSDTVRMPSNLFTGYDVTGQFEKGDTPIYAA